MTYGSGGRVGTAGNVLLAALVQDVLSRDSDEDGDCDNVRNDVMILGGGINVLWASSLEHWSKIPAPSAPEPVPIRLDRRPPPRPELTSVVSPA